MTTHGRLRVGPLEIGLVCQGFAPIELDPELPGRRVDWAAEHAATPWAFAGDGAWAWHVHAFVIRTSHGTVLVDAGLGSFAPFRPWTIEHSVDRALSTAGVEPGDVRHVVLTHLHNDHAGGTVTSQGEPAFPHATVHVHAADWEHFSTADDPDDYAAWRAMGRLEDTGLLDTDPDDRTIVPGLRVIHTPGHTPGHRSVLVDAGAAGTLLLTGDLLHLPVQVAHPSWPSEHDEDPGLGARSREGVLGRARDEAWHVAVSHFAEPLGRVVADGRRQRWVRTVPEGTE